MNLKHSLSWYFYIQMFIHADPSFEKKAKKKEKYVVAGHIFLNAKWCLCKIFILSSFVDSAIYLTTQFPYGNPLKTCLFFLKSHKRPNWVLGQFHNCKLLGRELAQYWTGTLGDHQLSNKKLDIAIRVTNHRASSSSSNFQNMVNVDLFKSHCNLTAWSCNY